MITNIPTAQKVNNKLQGVFYPLQKEELIALRQAKLINNTAFVHLALRYENPFCDRPVQIIPKEFALSWNIPESSIYKAIAKLKKLGLILIKSGRLLIEWISKSSPNTTETVSNQNNQYKTTSSEAELSDLTRNYQIRESIIRSEKKLSDLAKNYQIREKQKPEDIPRNNSSFSQTPQTDQTFHTLQTPEEKKIHTVTNIKNEEKNNQEIFNNLPSNNNAKITQEPQNLGLENKFRPSNTKESKNSNQEEFKITQTKPKPYSPQPINWRWLPNGPWLVDAKLDVNFQEWLAKKWVIKYGDDIYEAKANVLSYFRNDPVKLGVRWEQYQKEYIAKAENIKTRLNHGCKISDEQKQEAIANRNAIKSLLPEQQQTSQGSEGGIQNSEFGIRNSEFGEVAQRMPQAGRSTEFAIESNPHSPKQLTANNNESAEVFEAEVIEDFWAETEETHPEPISTNIPDDVDWDKLQPETQQYENLILQEYYQQFENSEMSRTENGGIENNQGQPLHSQVTSDEVIDGKIPANSSIQNSEFRTHNSTTVTDEFGRSVRYQDFTGIAERQSQEISAEQRKKVGSMISDFLNSFKQQKAQEKAEAEAEAQKKANEQLYDLNLLNQDLACPILRKDSSTQRRVKQYLDLGYQADYDEDGYVQNLYGNGGEDNV